jgi:aspartyl-tRNA(Asn)/glutamyl-tRNA(Gln) amidotransferase subunit B
MRGKLPELAEIKKERFMAQYGLPLYDANILTNSRVLADYFESCMNLVDNSKAKMISNWLLGDFTRLLNATNTDIENIKVSPEQLVELLSLVDKGAIGGPATKAVFEEMFYGGKGASTIVAEKELGQISDADELRKVVRQVIVDNKKAVSDYNDGKQQALAFITGQVMKASRGRANPSLVREILIQELGGK